MATRTIQVRRIEDYGLTEVIDTIQRSLTTLHFGSRKQYFCKYKKTAYFIQVDTSDNGDKLLYIEVPYGA